MGHLQTAGDILRQMSDQIDPDKFCGNGVEPRRVTGEICALAIILVTLETAYTRSIKFIKVPRDKLRSNLDIRSGCRGSR